MTLLKQYNQAIIATVTIDSMKTRTGKDELLANLDCCLQDVPKNSTNPPCEFASRVTRETLDAHAVDAELMCMDIAFGLEKRLAGMVDVMVVNPPYVPTPDYEVGREGIASAWAGGENGRSVIDRILPVADRLLSDKGWLYMVTLTTNDPSQICLLMRKKGQVDMVAGNLTFEMTIFALEGYNTSSQSTRGRVRTAAEDHSIQITAFMELERTESPRTLNPFSFQERAPGAQGIELFVTWRLGCLGHGITPLSFPFGSSGIPVLVVDVDLAIVIIIVNIAVAPHTRAPRIPARNF
ncbi:hypothetical protein NC651_000868 [Populus alba x Populus x berolinensis]|nr:hypothetical protein NC651_000868 [Populus alba x Populus x berolinensis]